MDMFAHRVRGAKKHDRLIQRCVKHGSSTSILQPALGSKPNGDACQEELLWQPTPAPQTRKAASAHAERDASVCIVNATTPVHYFHLLRRQVNLPHKKPPV
jgi:2-oxoglutarate dehydrogenase complex dehydrogenase (E1) component-like enzyme